MGAIPVIWPLDIVRGRGVVAMAIPRVLVVSEQQLVSQGLKLIIENAGSAEVVTAQDEATAASLMADLTPRIVVVDRDAIDDNPDRAHFDEEYPDKLVLISSTDDRMVVYSREKVDSATLENLLETIRENED